MKKPGDAILIEGLKRGYKDSYEQVYRKYYHLLIQFAKKYIKSSGLAEDAVQDVFLKLWEAREQLNEHYSLKSFLYTSLKNHILNLIRDSHQEIYEAYEPRAVLEKGRNEVEENIIYLEYEQIAQKALTKLPAKRRRIFEMKRFSGLSNDQIAQELGITVPTVKSQYYRGSQSVKHYLRQHIKSFEDIKL
jgi:RNA polymerase sigma-70 factor (ECF subfamily)